MFYPDYLRPVLARIVDQFGKEIWCDKGWWPLIAELDSELSKIDPWYTIYQVKEKFGSLSFYFASSNPNLDRQLRDVVATYQRRAASTCEATGSDGVLMKRNGVFKTLNQSFAAQGSWQQAVKP